MKGAGPRDARILPAVLRAAPESRQAGERIEGIVWVQAVLIKKRIMAGKIVARPDRVI